MANKSSPGRDIILQRIREALTQPAPHPSDHHVHTDDGSLRPAAGHFHEWLPIVGDSFEDRVQLFAANASALRAEFIVCDSLSAAMSQLSDLARVCGWKQTASHNSPWLSDVTKALNLPVLVTDGGYDTFAMEKCDAGITACEALIAQTGTVLITGRTCGGRALSVLPHHHVVIARHSQMLPDLGSAFALLQKKFAGEYPSCISFITGPSRTGDIERILVLGAHGPRRLTILLIPD